MLLNPVPSTANEKDWPLKAALLQALKKLAEIDNRFTGQFLFRFALVLRDRQCCQVLCFAIFMRQNDSGRQTGTRNHYRENSSKIGHALAFSSPGRT
jgi:hypothetical protein